MEVSGTHDNSITFSTALDNAQLEKDLAGLTKKIEKQEQKIAELSAKRDEAREKGLFDMKTLDREKAKLHEIEEKLAKIRAVAKDKSFGAGAREDAKMQIPVVQQERRDQQTRVNALQAEWNKTQNAAERYAAQLSEAEDTLNRQKVEAGDLVRQIEEASRKAMTPIFAQADERLSSILEGLKKQQSAVTAINEAFGDVVDMRTKLAGLSEELAVSAKIGLAGMAKTAVGAIDDGISSVLNNIRKIPESFKNLPKILNSVFSKGAKIIKSFGKNLIKVTKRLNVFSGLSKSLGSTFKWLGRTIKQALVFSVIYKGLSILRDQMGAYLTVNGQFSSSLQQLKGVLLTAFQPIYDAVLPALTSLMNVLSRVIAAVSQFTAVLFGTTAKQAQKNAKALYGQAKATEAAGSAAEDAAGSLAGFDEINSIQTEKQGGGGGAPADGAGPLFDWEYEDTPFPDWGEAFSALLDGMLNGIPKLKEAFKGFSDWLNSLTKKLYNMLTFPGVLDKVEQLGRDLAGAFNGLVGDINWYQLGQALGAGLNLALQFLTELIYTFDWIALGGGLAGCVNGLVSEIDWYDFGRLLWAKFKIALETLAGFLLEPV